MEEVKFKLNRSLNTPYGKKMEGAVIGIKCDANGTPTDQFWRARLKDSEVDNCIEIAKQIPIEKPAKEEEKINKKKRNK